MVCVMDSPHIAKTSISSSSRSSQSASSRQVSTSSVHNKHLFSSLNASFVLQYARPQTRLVLIVNPPSAPEPTQSRSRRVTMHQRASFRDMALSNDHGVDWALRKNFGVPPGSIGTMETGPMSEWPVLCWFSKDSGAKFGDAAGTLTACKTTNTTRPSLTLRS